MKSLEKLRPSGDEHVKSSQCEYLLKWAVPSPPSLHGRGQWGPLCFWVSGAPSYSGSLLGIWFALGSPHSPFSEQGAAKVQMLPQIHRRLKLTLWYTEVTLWLRLEALFFEQDCGYFHFDNFSLVSGVLYSWYSTQREWYSWKNRANSERPKRAGCPKDCRSLWMTHYSKYGSHEEGISKGEAEGRSWGCTSRCPISWRTTKAPFEGKGG